MSAAPVTPGSPSPGPSRQQTPRRPSAGEYLQAFRRATRRRLASGDPGAMTILEHIEALRARLFQACLAMVITTGISFMFSSQLVNYLSGPIGGPGAMVSIEVTENISVFMRVSLLGGVILGFPFVVYQLIAFMMPGLKPHERRWIYLLIPAASILFLSGVAFAWFEMVPVALPFLLGFLGIQTAPRPLNYFSFVTSFLFWVGISFEMPLVIFFLAKLKFVTARQLVHRWRYALMGIATLAAIVTPTVDPVSMLIVALPLVGLYFIGILLAWMA